MPSLHLIYGTDSEGDDCVLLQVLDDQNEHIRYATEAELKGFLHSMNERMTDDSEVLEIPANIGMCVTCGGECSHDGTCEEACRTCGEHWTGGDGYDGQCPSCADASENDEDDELAEDDEDEEDEEDEEEDDDAHA